MASDEMTLQQALYVAIGHHQPARLADLRATLRKRMQQPPLMDARGLASGIEAAYRRMWQEWCARA